MGVDDRGVLHRVVVDNMIIEPRDVNVIHRYWAGEMPRYVRTFGDEAREVAGVPVIDWSDDILPDKALELVEGETDLRHRSNVIRYWLLLTYGGMWIDGDVEVLRDVRPLIARAKMTTGEGLVALSKIGSKLEGGVMVTGARGTDLFTWLLRDLGVWPGVGSSRRSGAHYMTNYRAAGSLILLAPELLHYGREWRGQQPWTRHWFATSAGVDPLTARSVSR